jgi:hypothetical protein
MRVKSKPKFRAIGRTTTDGAIGTALALALWPELLGSVMMLAVTAGISLAIAGFLHR